MASSKFPRSEAEGRQAPRPHPSHTAASDNFLEGKLLIALPGMPDPRFEKSVIFVCAHSTDGAMGIIINHPVDGLSFGDLMGKLELEVTDEISDLPVLFGGPVDTGRGFVLHSCDYESPEPEATLPVTDGISLTATVDILRAMGTGGGPRHALFALGYAGWGPGQIEDEIRANGWLHCDADTSIVFEVDAAGKWTSALRKLGIDASGLTALVGQA